ncbi:MAG: cob(I)yrinic acid a,c-diamide adenosyltransferase [Deltaproteobacteria bacterium]|nr:cob(I)yrinic acid a,c-diamide adenosyltransferase [Candidatus Anaeroferrophillus wilburensis]MBN2889479.1 cob(I)yrinic acid a,c-diamide adenosyltransferase [Deltaproteobacteria bacterium]
MGKEKRKGLIVVNTGHGKGKTTAALGTAFRAAGHGFHIIVIQFIKGSWKYGELEAAKKFDNLTITPMGTGFLKLGAAEPEAADCDLAEHIWQKCEEAIFSGAYDLVICDEVNYALAYKLLPVERVVATLKKKPAYLHVILTGRDAPPEIIELADLVTEMKEIKHPYQEGITAQRGIEF